ncbi:MAG: protein phosphatase 2C domain-containing protein [Candidatus Margulisiibacteriota bacterium]
MAPLGVEAVRIHLSGINDPRLTITARTHRLGRFQTEIQSGRVRLQGVITNPHLLKALDAGRTHTTRELALHKLLQTPTLVLNEIEIEAVRALSLLVPGEESVSQTAAAIVSRLSPSPSIFSDDAFTVRHGSPKLAPPPPRQDDLQDLQELQALEARRPEIKARVGRTKKAIELLLPYERWSPLVEQVIEGLGGQLKADVALAERAAVLYKKINASAPANLTGKDHFELPETLIVAPPGELRHDTRATTEIALAAARGRLREIIISFNEMKSMVESHALALAEGKVTKVIVDEEVRTMRHYLNSLQNLAWYLEVNRSIFSRTESKHKLIGMANLNIATKFVALQDLIFEVVSKFGEAEEKNREQIGEVLGANNRLVEMIEKLKAFSDLTGQTIIEELDKLALETKTATLGLLNKTNEDNKNAVDAVKAALCVKVQLRPQVQPPQPVPPPAPPEVIKFRQEFAALMSEMRKLFPTLNKEAQDVLEKAPSDEEIAEIERITLTQEEAIEGTNAALETRNDLVARSLSAEAADLFKKIQRCMEKYIGEKFGLFAIEPIVGTQQTRVHERVEVIRQNTGKFGEILQVEALGFVDKDNKVVRKAQIVIGDGTVFSAGQIAGSAAPVSPAPDAVPPTILPTPPATPAPGPSIGERLSALGKRIGGSIYRAWRWVDRPLYRFQTKVANWTIEIVRDYITMPKILRVDAYFGSQNKWSNGMTTRTKRFGRDGLISTLSKDTGDIIAELHKVGSTYKLKTINGNQVKIKGQEVVKAGDWTYVIDIFPVRRSFRKGKGVEQIAGGESGEIVLENGALITDRAGRLNNEDGGGHAWIDKDLELFVVADGMGGHNAGEVASRTAVQAMIDEFKKGAALEKAITIASRTIYQMSKMYPECKGMGTTLVATLFDHKNKKRFIAWVGDSRAKYISSDTSQEGQTLTRDHSAIWKDPENTEAIGIERLAKKLPINDGNMEQIEKLERDPRWHAICNVVERYVGREQSIIISVAEIPYGQGPADNYLILSSDGLAGGLSEQEVTGLVRRGGTPIEIARRLVAAALQGGTRDNVTVAVIPAPAIDVTQLREEVTNSAIFR